MASGRMKTNSKINPMAVRGGVLIKGDIYV
jgi:hypothetical protein